MSKHISYNLTERNKRSSNLMAELLKKADCLSIIDNSLWVYNQKTGCFDNCKANEVETRGNIRSYISKHKKIEIMKKRINANGNLLSSGNPRATYVGIRLKDKYRVS